MEIIEKQDFRTVCPEVRVAIRKRGMSMIKRDTRQKPNSSTENLHPITREAALPKLALLG
jgi:hypothetical protein